jgi:hypothetical protein
MSSNQPRSCRWQAHALGDHLRRVTHRVDVVIVSPLMRALETAVGAFGQSEWKSGTGHQPLMAAQPAEPGKVSQHAAVCSSGVPKFVAVELCR